MRTIMKEVIIPDNRRINLDIDVPADLPVGRAVVTLTIEPKNAEKKHRNRLGELFGAGKGEVWIADDFDAPLEEFMEYM